MTMRTVLAAILCLAAPAALAARSATPGELVVADFDTGAKPDNLGGDFGAWIADPADPQQGALESFERTQRYGGKGWSLRLIYSVQSTRPAYGGLWLRLQGLDARRFGALHLRVKGDAALGFTTRFKLELKDQAGRASSAYVEGVSAEWQDLAVPLSTLSGSADLAHLKELVIVIEDRTATAKQGVLYLDDLRFTPAMDSAGAVH